MNKKHLFFIISIILCVTASVKARMFPAEPGTSDAVVFSAGVDLAQELKKPTAEVIYTIRGSDVTYKLDTSFAFASTQTNFIFFGYDQTQNQSFVTHSVFDEELYFPNNLFVTFEIIGKDPINNMMTILKGETLIPENDVVEPGIEYYIAAQDSREAKWYFGNRNSITQTVPLSAQRIFIPISSVITKKITPSGGTIIFPDTNPYDGNVSLIIPPGAVSQEITITATLEGGRIAHLLTAQDEPLVVYRFEPQHIAPNQQITMSLLYPDRNSDGIVDGTNLPEENVSIWWHDGFEWRQIGGSIDTMKNLVTVSVGHLGRFAIFPRAPSSKDMYRPKEKIITPALQDTINDYAQFDNLGTRTDVVIHIYDITGREIRSLQSPYQWDGRDDDGDIVESGVYIYQFKVDGAVISGTIAVAK